MSFAGTILDLDGTVYRSGNRRDRFGVTNRRNALLELLATVHTCTACQFDLNQHVGQNLNAVADDLQIWNVETRFRSTYRRLIPP